MHPSQRILTGLVASAAIASSGHAQADSSLHYPVAKTVDQVDDYHGTKIADPYRWLENSDAPDTRAWIDAENAVTSQYLSAIPQRETIRKRLTQLWDYPKFQAPWRAGHKYFHFENTGLQNQSVLFVQEDLGKPGRVLLDPNTLSSDGTIALSATDVSPRGKYLAYSTSASGSDWQEFHVRDVQSGKDMGDDIKWVKFSGAAWTHDEAGFFYSRYEAPAGDSTMTGANRNQKLYYHRVGTPQSADVLVYERPDAPDFGFSPQVTEDGQYCIITVWHGTDPRNRVYYIDLDNTRHPKIDNPVVRLLDGGDASFQFIGNIGTRFIFQTDRDAPRGRVISINIEDPDEPNWLTIVHEDSDALDRVLLVWNRLIASYLRDAHSDIRIISLQTGATVHTVPLPTLGTVAELNGRNQDDEFFFSFTSFLQPTSTYRYEMPRDVVHPIAAPKLDVDVSDLETRQVWVTSKDGTRVPMFITAKKGLVLDGANPTILYGYGGFNIPVTPAFSVSMLTWVRMGGVYAVANIRGGGEYGKAWHEAGTLAHKQNVFDDFIACAEYLEQQKITSPARLAIRGGSNGGLLVGAVMTQRPDLIGAALPAVGVMDMLRFQKFTIGWAWTSDYGSSDDSTQFRTLLAYSPLHNLHAGTHYPATLITTADHDDRVVPAHSFKFAAALQAAQGGPAPVLIRIDTKAGHGAGKPTAKLIDEATDQLAFLVHVFGMTVQ